MSGVKKIQKSFSLVEAILAAAVFMLTVSAFASALIYGQVNSLQMGNRARANFLAEEGLEAVRNIRDNNFSNLADGSYGLEIQNNRWELVSEPDVTDIFTRQIEIGTVNSDTKEITAEVSWNDLFRGESSLILKSYLANW